jgi:G3E family GTPase
VSLLSLPAAARPGSPAPGRRGVTLLSGFLGSGKTTLLRRELAAAAGSPPAVLVNDVGQAGIDDVLLSGGDQQPVLLSGGCACCTRREELALALAGLLDAEQRGAPRRDHVVIETSGLSDPGPVAFTLANDPVLKHHYALVRVCVTVDVLVGLASLERHDVAMRQLLAADDVIVTKADLAGPAQVEQVVARLRELNRSATLSVTAGGDVLRSESASSPAAPRPPARPASGPEHHRGISTLEITTREPLDWQAFSVWLSLLLHRHGPDVLRVKGILDVQDTGPVALHGVQHVVHRPEHLTGPVPAGSRQPAAFRDLDPELLRRSFHAFLSTS